VRILGEAKDNSFSSSELARAGPIGARRNNSWMQEEERESRRGERGEEWVGGGGDTDKEFSVRGFRGGGLSFPEESRKLGSRVGTNCPTRFTTRSWP